jgi:hypothetical protein
MSIHYRQGDVLLRAVGELPKGCVEVSREKVGPHGRVTLAHGERTGHAHALRALCVTGFKKASSEYEAMTGLNDFILVGGSGAAIRHEHTNGLKAEHDAINLPPGNYEVAQQVEYSPAALTRVAD